MHQAPSVLWQVSRTRVHAAVLLSLSALAVASQGVWWWERPEWDPVQRLCLIATLLLLVGAWGSWARTEPGQLHWDGVQWTWAGRSGTPVSGVPIVAIDGQRLMLVVFRAARHGVPQWLWLVPAGDPARWRALRRALFAFQATGPAAVGALVPAGPVPPGSAA